MQLSISLQCNTLIVWSNGTKYMFLSFSDINKTPYSIFAFPMYVANSMVARLLLLIFSIYTAVVHLSHAITVKYIEALFIVYCKDDYRYLN